MCERRGESIVVQLSALDLLQPSPNTPLSSRTAIPASACACAEARSRVTSLRRGSGTPRPARCHPLDAAFSFALDREAHPPDRPAHAPNSPNIHFCPASPKPLRRTRRGIGMSALRSSGTLCESSSPRTRFSSCRRGGSVCACGSRAISATLASRTKGPSEIPRRHTRWEHL